MERNISGGIEGDRSRQCNKRYSDTQHKYGAQFGASDYSRQKIENESFCTSPFPHPLFPTIVGGIRRRIFSFGPSISKYSCKNA